MRVEVLLERNSDVIVHEDVETVHHKEGLVVVSIGVPTTKSYSYPSVNVSSIGAFGDSDGSDD